MTADTELTPAPERRETYGVKMREGEEAIRWIDLTAEDIATLAHHQITGDFGPVSDAMTALHLIEALAHRIADATKATS